MAQAYLGLGANLGAREQTLRGAVKSLEEGGLRITGLSPLYRSAALGGPEGQPPYLNAVLEAQTSLCPEALLRLCLEVEGRFGRERSVRWGARTLDIDVLLYDRLRMRTPILRIPHPRMHLRRFVLQPLRDLRPELRIPGFSGSLDTLLASLGDADPVELYLTDWMAP